MNGYLYDSKWNKLTARLQNPQPGDCVAVSAEEVIVVMSDSQMIAITESSDSSSPLPLGEGQQYSISERAKAAGFIVSVLSDTPAGRRIKVFRRNDRFSTQIRMDKYRRKLVDAPWRFMEWLASRPIS